MLRSAAGDRDLKSFQHIQGLLVEDGVIGGGEAGIHQDLCLGQSGLDHHRIGEYTDVGDQTARAPPGHNCGL